MREINAFPVQTTNDYFAKVAAVLIDNLKIPYQQN